MRFLSPEEHFRTHLKREQLLLMRNTALSAAGFSAGIIVLLAQTIGTLAYSATALWAAMFSLVVWLYGGLYTSAFLSHDECTYKHINIILAAVTGLLGYILLFVAVVAILWQLSIAASIVLIILGVVLAYNMFTHFQKVDKWCNESGA